MPHSDTTVYLLFPAGTRVIRKNGSRSSSIPLATLTAGEQAVLLTAHPVDATAQPDGLVYERRQARTDGEIGSHCVPVSRTVTDDQAEAIAHQQAGGIVLSHTISRSLVEK